MKKKISEEKCKYFLEENGFEIVGNKIYYNSYRWGGKIVGSEFVKFDEIMNYLNGVNYKINPGCDADVLLTILFKHKDELLEG